MSSSISDSEARRRLGLTAIGAFSIVIAVNAAAGLYKSRHWTARGFGVTSWKWRLLNHSARPGSFLVLGDSSGLRGVHAGRIEDELGAPTLNLCTYGEAGLYHMPWLLERAIRLSGPPRRVLVVNNFESWESERMSLDWAAIPVGWREWIALNPSPFEGVEDVVRGLWTRLFPLASSYKPSVFFQVPKSTPPDHRLEALNGFEGFIPQTTKAALDLGAADRGYAGKEFVLSQRGFRALRRMSELATANGVQIFIVNPPVRASLHGQPDYSRYFRQAQAALREAAALPSLLYIETPMILPDARFYDHDHLFYDGAVTYTDLILDLLRRNGA